MIEKKIDAVLLPLGISLTESDGVVTVLNAARDSGDAFALFFLGAIAAIFSVGVGDRIAGGTGMIVGLVVASPAWGMLLVGALKRAVNTTRVIAKKGAIEIVRGPVGKTVRTLADADVSSIVARSSEHRSSTRGGTVTVQRTHSVWAVLTNGKDELLLEPLESDAQAKFVERSLWRALRT